MVMNPMGIESAKKNITKQKLHMDVPLEVIGSMVNGSMGYFTDLLINRVYILLG